MTTWAFQIDSYRVDLQRQDLTLAGKKLEAAMISCNSAPGPTADNKKLIAYFWTDGEHVKHSNETLVRTNGVFGHVHLPFACYAAWLDLLRNEGPLQASISDNNARANGLSTGREPASSGDLD